MTTKKAISEVVGHIRVADGSSDAVYRALRPLLCASCGRPIAEGEIFTRRKPPGQHLRLMPQCTDCAPVQFHTSDRKIRSALIEALLSPAPETPLTHAPAVMKPLTDEAAQAREKREKAAREVQ
ncbi:MAG: hypothetical protein H0T92_20295, partial [Pyrinomonadaceae bacterium]|nr:hypothetical protein [Pyrinomonadaceae bacterium]